MAPRTGRPKSDKPKEIDVKVRIDKETNEQLIDYANRHNISRTEVIREGIQMILNKK